MFNVSYQKTVLRIPQHGISSSFLSTYGQWSWTVLIFSYGMQFKWYALAWLLFKDNFNEIKWTSKEITTYSVSLFVIWPKVCATIRPICWPSTNCFHKVRKAELYRMLLYAVALQFALVGGPQTCSSMTVPLCTNRCWWTHGLLMLEWKSLSGLHRVLTSAPPNTFGKNLDARCSPGLLTQH